MERKIYIELTPSQQEYLLDLLVAERESLETDLEKDMPETFEGITRDCLGACEQLIDVVHGAESEGILV